MHTAEMILTIMLSERGDSLLVTLSHLHQMIHGDSRWILLEAKDERWDPREYKMHEDFHVLMCLSAMVTV